MAAILPWEAIRTEYVEGRRDTHGGVVYPTYEDLARKYTCAFSTIATRAAREQWPQARCTFQESYVEGEQARVQAEACGTLRVSALIDASALRCAERGLAWLEKAFEHWANQDSVVDLELLSRMVLTFQRVGHLAQHGGEEGERAS